jgi:phosphonoacetaldehyde hydrolase
MTAIHRARYRGPLKAVIFDWAGTTVDFGSFAPVAACIEVFRGAGVEVTPEEARRPMGSHKRVHLAAVLATPRVTEEWTRVHGRAPGEADVDRLFASFVPLQVAAVGQHATLIPGLVETVKVLRRRRLKIGTTTGYVSTMMGPLVEAAARQGYRPDATFTPDQVSAGRPWPWMCFRNLEALEVHPPAACVKVGDTVLDVQEGLNAGMWTVAVSASGNEVGLRQAELEALPSQERTSRLAAACQRLMNAGAHHVIESVAALPSALDHVEALLEGGEMP